MRILLTLLLIGVGFSIQGQDYKKFPMWDHSRKMEDRVNDLVSRLTLEEKVQQMLNAAPAIPRLGIPAYDWWNEVLHGVARTPYKTTSYPQAIGMAATWDTASLALMADFSATEGRAVHNLATKQGRNGERYMGLTYWTPNINIFRDPRWGRGQETYGEDPFLTGQLGYSFVRGLQGSDPRYLKAAACAKHFAVHSGPEPTRHSDNFNPSTYDLWDTYLPAFKELVVHANVAGVMCAYNAVNTQPCCANDLLMTDILRKQWKFTGYVTSDCWGLDDFFRYHKTHKDSTAAAVDALIHGTDVECGVAVYTALVGAVKGGLIAESQINESVRRLFTIRYRLGMFDPADKVPFANTPPSALEAPAHKAHALKMAQQSIVLLKNEANTLPLSKKIKKIAVIGPNANNRIAVLGNYNGIPSRVVTVLEGLKEKLGEKVDIQYELGTNFTNDTLLVYSEKTGSFMWKGTPGFFAEYFSNKELKGTPVGSRMESTLDHSWQRGDAIMNGLLANQFSARYTTEFVALTDGPVTLEVNADDGYRLMVDGQEKINAWTRNRWGARTFTLDAKKDTRYKIVLEYWQGDDFAIVSLRPGVRMKNDFTALANRVKDADAILFVGGISPQLEGEEMSVNEPGFNGGDRSSILLPKVQTELMKALQKTGKPVVFVMMTGSAIAIPWEDENIPAILNTWYGGQSAGTAIADVLFGDYNPAGRLPVTFYKGDEDLPSFTEYGMENRTYRYFKGKALYPFGYGLSYSRFQYGGLYLPVEFPSGRALEVTVTLKNTGPFDGEEVAQLYLSFPDYKGKAPQKVLKGFQRVFLKRGESREIRFTLSPDQMSLVNPETGVLFQPAGKMVISVGGGQPDVPNKSTSNVVTNHVQIK
ncbi:MAG: glycoside hydrolase family 3 C-terminal domain-containing protein [Chitinophagaceae bacterium]|nr:glycoside hydrolase family 3 C-terminal domain-containing protein [Chitinophagaceae bacterium]